MITTEKIEQWIKDVEERPDYAPVILQFIASRLRELTERNEMLAAENIALQTGQRVEIYEQRIAYLEYQLELLKRQLGVERIEGENLGAAGRPAAPVSEALSLLVYDARGRMLRIALNPASQDSNSAIGMLSAAVDQDSAPCHLEVVPSTEELLFVFTSGRVSSHPATLIPLSRFAPGEVLAWDRAAIPDEPHGGESLACVISISRMLLAEFILQVSRRGNVKKIRASMAQSILANRYIGTGVKQSVDRTFDILLSGKDDRLALVSREGYLLILGIKDLPVTLDDAIRLSATDHLASAFLVEPGRSILVMTQIGKALHLVEDSLDLAGSPRTKGQATFSRQRREQGVRVVGAGAVSQNDWGVALHQDGRITAHAMQDVFNSGTVGTQSELVAFEFFSIPATSG